jgi:hypothetical protein
VRLPLPRLAIAAALAAACLGLFGSTPAYAAYEQIGTFAGSPNIRTAQEIAADEEVQLGGVDGMAVNSTGAGGVPAGTVFATSTGVGGESGRKERVAMFTPTAGGGLAFSQAWSFEGPGFEERCGPDGDPAFPHCGVRVANGRSYADVEVDQVTGNVYVYVGQAGTPRIQIYKPDGSERIGAFGGSPAGSETVATSPEKIHTDYYNSMALGAEGTVYLYDEDSSLYHRLMVFKPQNPGDYESYAYAGEVVTGDEILTAPRSPALDSTGNIYAVGQQHEIAMYAPQVPAPYPASPASPLCTFDFTKGGIYSMTVNPKTGEVFFFSYKQPKRLRRLGPCDPATGKFTEIEPEPEALTVTPERDDLSAMAFDPLRQVSPGRPPGVLYGGASGPTSSNGIGVGQPGQSSLGYIFALAEENPPVVEAESLDRVGAQSAQLSAQIDPKGFKTRYAFQYIAEAAYLEGGESFAGAQEAPLGGVFLQGTAAGESAAVTLTGLLPDTAYRYRVVAASNCSPGEAEKVCEDAGAAQAFRTFPNPPPGLPDHRAYELVSPPQKNGGQVLPADPGISSCGSEAECKPGETYDHFPMQSSPDGDSVVYEGTSFAPGIGVPSGNQYIARRTESGWQSTNLMPSLVQAAGRGYMAFAEDLSQGLFGQQGPALSPAAPPEYKNLYAESTSAPLALAPLLGAEPPNRVPTEGGSFEMRYAGASAGFSRVFFEANDALSEETPFAPQAEDGGATKFNLYEWDRATGRLALVNVLPGNATTQPGAAIGAPSAHGVSANGSRVFWSDEAGQLFVREGGQSTREVPDPGKFLAADTDGSKVLLGNGHVYDLEEETTTDLTAGKGGFEGIAGQSDDLSHLYFLDTEVLSGAEENGEGAKAQAGKDNLYAWSEEGPTSYVATLLASDNGAANLAHSNDWSPLPSRRTAQASPGGRYLTFLSQALLSSPLPGYSNVGPCETNHAGGFVKAPCPEVFLYDSAGGELSCASCGRSGTRPPGFSALRVIKGGGMLPQPRYLTDSGRLYFDSQDSLALADTNEGVEDVYEYEPDGVGSCGREDGCVSLISAGTGTVDSNFLAADPTGRNVFFTTRDQLALKDRDELIDLYDAREEGGIAAETETARAECQGEACQPVAAAPNDPTPASAGLRGAGNVKQGPSRKARCPKGRRRVAGKGKKSRCVKPKLKRAVHHEHGGAK